MNLRTRVATKWLISFVLPFLALLLVMAQAAYAEHAVDEAMPSETAASPAAAVAAVAGFPKEPPDLSKITVSTASADGVAQVTGGPGTVPANSNVVIINLNAHNLITATANSSGGFQASLFAPRGSSLLIKYETQGDRIRQYWEKAVVSVVDELLVPLPGAVLRVGGSESSLGETQNFHVVGGHSPNQAPKEWMGWYLEGALTTPSHTGGWEQSLLPGEPFTMTVDLRATSPAFNCSQSPLKAITINVGLRKVFAVDGAPLPQTLWFDSYLFTPTGLPIEMEGWVPYEASSGPRNFDDLFCAGQNTLGAHLMMSFKLPNWLLEGYYTPVFMLEPPIDKATDVPQAVVWQHNASLAQGFPILRVGDAAPPQIPWVLFADEPINGSRGVFSHQDLPRFQMVNRVTTPAHMAVIPAVDRRSKAPIAYQITPYSPWLSNTDRRVAPPPVIPVQLPSGELSVEIIRPDQSSVVLGPTALQQSSVRTPSTPGGAELASGTGHLGDIYQLYHRDGAFRHEFSQEGLYEIYLRGMVQDIYGNSYNIDRDYELMVANVLDIDPNVLSTTPLTVDDFFTGGVHLYPPVPADVHVVLTHVPNSDPAQAQVTEIRGKANDYGYYQPSPAEAFQMTVPGEYRVDISAIYKGEDKGFWYGSMTWGSVVESPEQKIVAHGRRGMDYESDTIDDMPIWFRNEDLPTSKLGIENYYPYLSGDVHWGLQIQKPEMLGDSIHTIITLEDLTPTGQFYQILRDYYPKATNTFRWPPKNDELSGLNKRIAIGEAPVFIATSTGRQAEVHPDEIAVMSYWYGSSQRPDARVRELISEDNMGTAYWRFDDTYGYQIGEAANGDQPGDIKWEFGGLVFRVISETNPIQEYAIYSSLWVLLPDECDDFGCARVTPPFQDATGASINGGPILTIDGKDIDMLFLPKCIRPGDVVYVDDTVAFCGHIGPPLDSRVDVTITSPDGTRRSKSWHANKIGWIYDPAFDFDADQLGRWTVDVHVEHDRPYPGNGVIPQSHNSGTVMGTSGRYEFYVVEPDAPPMHVANPPSGYITWPAGKIVPIVIEGQSPPGATEVYYTIYDKGIVMGQGSVQPDPSGWYTLVYDAKKLHTVFSMLSLTAREGMWEGLADEVSIRLFAVGQESHRAASVTLLGEEIWVESGPDPGPHFEFHLPMTFGD